MRNILVLGLLFLSLVYLTECGRFGGGSRGGSRSSSSGGWGKSWGSSSRSGGSSSWGSSGSSYKPSSSSSWGSSGSSYKPSSSWNTGSSWSSSGSSGGSVYKPSSSWNSGSSWSSSGSGSSYIKPSYPASTGLSGSGSSYKPSYPASTGLSGSGSSYKPSYPPSTGLSGSGSSYKPSYPPSTGLSGSGSSYKPSYPPSTGLSGSGSNYKPSSSWNSGSSWSTSGSNYKPNYSGSGSGSYGNSGSNTHYKPTNTYNTNAGYHPGVYLPHNTYYTSPQHVYVTQYRDSGSRYSDLLTGLALYDLGRSHSHYHNNYYYDDYYRNRYSGSNSGNNYRPEIQPEKEAVCSLIVKEDGKTNVLKVPCQIVSTFTEDSKKVEIKRVCSSNVTVIKQNVANVSKPLNTNITSSNSTILNRTIISTNITGLNGTLNSGNITGTNNTALNITSSATNSSDDSIKRLLANIEYGNNMTKNMLLSESNINFFNKLDEGVGDPANTTLNKMLSDLGFTTSTTIPPPVKNSNVNTTMKYESTSVNGTATITNVTIISPNETFINITVCNETNSNNVINDPLSVTGTHLDASKTECAVDIKTKDSHLRNKIDCMILLEYSKKPIPKKDPPLLPKRETLKSWLSKPPWWASIFIAV